jgi:Fe-S cluster assembly protein SufD
LILLLYLNYYKIQNQTKKSYKISHYEFYQNQNSKLEVFTITLNGIFIRNNLNIIIKSKNCQSNLYGLFFTKNKEHIDNYTRINHEKENSISNQIYKGIISEESTGIFQGKIYVAENAKYTNAFQLNQNILISEKSKINTTPQLKIYNNDVKCSHGVTITKLNKNQIFYLKTRGIEEKKCK